MPRNKVNDARRSLSKKWFKKKPIDVDTNKIDYSILERADILLPNGYREVWLKIK